MRSRQFQYMSNLKRHARIHAEVQERPNKCDICESVFYQRSALVDHGRCHTGERPFDCHVCGMVFRVNFLFAPNGSLHGLSACL